MPPSRVWFPDTPRASPGSQTPARTAPCHAPAPGVNSPGMESTPAPTTPPRPVILVVDDDAEIRRSTCWLLAPWTTLAAGSVDDACAWIERSAVDVVLCDLRMPRRNGLDLLAWIREHRPMLASSFALMTGGADESVVEAPGVPVVEKPFRRARLVAVVEALLAARAVGG